MNNSDSLKPVKTLLDTLSKEHLQGKDEVIRLAVIALLCGGHILVEDLPGLGKTTIALALAGVTGMSFGRVQCTSDLLPSDITGLSVYNRESGHFNFLPGPVFNNIVLLDEINRAMPRTQSAMLEAMEEKRVTIEGKTWQLPDPFMVFATQNPSDQSGTFVLPESQLDRFLICTGIGYPPEKLEKAIILSGGIREQMEGITPLISAEELLEARKTVARDIHLSEKVVSYLHSIVIATRFHPKIQTGLSTRAAICLAQSARAAAFLSGRKYVAPDDVKSIAVAVCAHRIVARSAQTTALKGELLREIIAGIPLPLV